MPLFGLILGMINPFEFVYVFINSVTLILFPLMLFYGLINYRMMLSGQTWHESGKNIKIYDLGPKQNLEEALGRNWLASLFYPFVQLQLPSDGTRFRTNRVSNMINTDNSFSQNETFRRRQFNL